MRALPNGAKNAVRRYASGGVLWDAAKPIRFRLEFAWLEQHFNDGRSVDRRVQLSGWYLF
jgi:hypothetical protein